MITKFKIFENNKKPKIGDFVVCYDGDSDLKEFLLNNVGKIVKIDRKGFGHKNHLGNYLVQYKNTPKILSDGFSFLPDVPGSRPMRKYEILYFSNNKKDCELYINMNKYNI